MLLINSIINGEDDFDSRVALRTEFVEHELLDILEMLKKKGNPLVLLQVCEFYESNIEDYEVIINEVEEVEEILESPVSDDDYLEP